MHQKHPLLIINILQQYLLNEHEGRVVANSVYTEYEFIYTVIVSPYSAHRISFRDMLRVELI